MQKTGVAGFSLIEIVISMLMVAIAACGFIRWQVAHIYAARQVEASANAMRLASELADWIRALPEEFSHQHNADIFQIFRQPLTSPAMTCFYSDCNPEQQIEFDLYEWRQRLLQALPGARVEVCHDDQSRDAQMHAWPCQATSSLSAPLIIKIGWQRLGSAQSLPQLVLAVGFVAP
jgi:type IV pilus assembly protein PilV